MAELTFNHYVPSSLLRNWDALCERKRGKPGPWVIMKDKPEITTQRCSGGKREHKFAGRNNIYIIHGRERHTEVEKWFGKMESAFSKLIRGIQLNNLSSATFRTGEINDLSAFVISLEHRHPDVL